MKQRYRKNYRSLCTFIISLLFANFTFAQNRTITGEVHDEQGELMIGVTIAVEGTANGTITNADGVYTLNVSNEAANLIFSYIGMETQIVPINNQTSISVQMKSGAINVEELVVVGYGTQKKVTITGALSSINTEEILASPSASPVNALAGKVTGLTSIQYSGQPGADDAQLFVRGVGTLNSSQAGPLIMVDGVERSFAQIDPNEIADITILKDASATAVYGIRGANGVILVTTRRGAIGKTKITVSTSTGFQSPVRLPQYADSYTYATVHRNAQIGDGVDPSEVTFNEDIIEAFRTNSEPILYPSTDWMDYVMKSYAPMSQSNFNLSGGTERVKYFASFGYLNQDGMLQEFDTGTGENYAYQRYNYRTNIDIEVTKKTQLQFSLGGQTQIRNEPASGDITQMWRMIYRQAIPFASPGVVDGKYIQDNGIYLPVDVQDPLSLYYGGGYTNNSNSLLNFDLALKQDLSKITKGLKFRAKASYNTNSVQSKTRSANPDIYTSFYARDYDPTLAEDDLSLVHPLIGRQTVPNYSESWGKGRNWYMEAALTYNRKFGEHEIGGLLLYNQRNTYYVGGAYNDIPRGYVGTAARATYNYKTKYLAEINVGYNGSENFQEDSRYGLFPAFSVGWIISEESFIKEKLSAIQYLKIRGSYGMVGSDRQGTSRFLYLPDSYTSGGAYNFGVNVPSYQPGFIESKIGNKEVTWETALKQNYGFDLIILESKLKVNFDYFIEDRKDILTTQKTVGLITGMESSILPAVNIGKVHNEGFELSVKWMQKMNDFAYWISPNITKNHNEIIFMDEVKQNEDYMYRTGGLVGQPFGFVCTGFYSDEDFDEEGNLLESLPKPAATVKPGDAIYQDLNSDMVINNDDQKAIGYPNYPLTTVGINAGFKFKGFDFTMQWVGATNTSRVLSESLKSPFGETGSFSLLQLHADESWTEATAATATQPRISFSNRGHNRNFNSTLWTIDASYIRLKNAELGYNFKGNLLSKIGAEKLRIYINGYNLLTFDKLDGIVDPESNTSTRPTYPVMKIYNIGAKVNF